MVWDFFVRYRDRELISRFLCEAQVIVCVLLERPLVCIWVKRWVGIIRRGKDGDRAMDGVSENLALV